jgi:hypothetical protein
LADAGQHVEHQPARSAPGVDLLPKADLRTPEERIRENDELVRRLEGRLPAEPHQRLVELLVGRDTAWASLERALGTERYLDVCEACVIMDREG